MASLMRSARPSSSWPSRADMAEDACSAVAISMKPKPRERPVSRSFTIVTLLAVKPACSKCAERSASLVLKERFPIKILVPVGESFPFAQFPFNNRRRGQETQNRC